MRPDHDLCLEVRRTVAAVGAVALLVPFAVIAALVVGNVGWLHRLDHQVAGVMVEYALGHPGWVRFMAVWSTVFHPMVWRVAALVLAVWLARRGARALAWWVAITMAVGGLLGVLLKLLFVRHRPDLFRSRPHQRARCRRLSARAPAAGAAPPRAADHALGRGRRRATGHLRQSGGPRRALDQRRRCRLAARPGGRRGRGRRLPGPQAGSRAARFRGIRLGRA